MMTGVELRSGVIPADGFAIRDEDGVQASSYAATEDQAWRNYCAPALDYPRCLDALRKAGCKAVRVRVMQGDIRAANTLTGLAKA